MKSFSWENLSFYYGKKLVLNDLNINIPSGSIVALLGNNGSGKTTLLKILSGLKSKNKLSYSVSFMIDGIRAYPYLSAIENLNYFEKLQNNNLLHAQNIMSIIGLNNTNKLKLRNFSLGMKQRLAIGLCLLKDADLYLFDEPLNGLDPDGILMFRRIINILKKRNKTVIISSHNFVELNEYCDLAIILKQHYNKIINYDYSVIEKIFRGD